MQDFHSEDLVWFDPGVGYVLPGEVVEFHKKAQVITVQAVINGASKTFTLNNLSSVRSRQDLGQNGLDDMVFLKDLNEASLLWNLRIRYDNRCIYTYIGKMLLSLNPYQMFEESYGLDSVSKYEGRPLGTLTPHLFAIGASAVTLVSSTSTLISLTGESGAGKTESCKLLIQYFAAVNKSSSNLLTEQILEALPLLESFCHAKTKNNDNSSRFGKNIQIFYKNGLISASRINCYLLEKSRVVSHSSDERNFHIFYEMLAGLSKETKDKYGLMSPEKYFYLNQGGIFLLDGKRDKEDFETLLSALQVLGFNVEEKETILKVLASILHLGNVYFHRKQLKQGGEGVEVGSDIEIKWAAHLLSLTSSGIIKALTVKQIEIRGEILGSPMNIDEALDFRDAVSKTLYSSLSSWLLRRINKILRGQNKKSSVNSNPHSTIHIVDMFGFEDLSENSFEQLCINYTNESIHHQFIKQVFKYEQVEYAKEKIEWTPVAYSDNALTIQLLSKKPVGIFHLLDDESNFPKASDVSFLEKCHYNHALNELYSRPRMASMEFGIKHYAGQIWYNVDGFLNKNRDTLRFDVLHLLSGSNNKVISKIFSETWNEKPIIHNNNGLRNQFNSMKPRTATIAARFMDSLQNLLSLCNNCHPLYVRCIKPNKEATPYKFDMPLVLEQLRYSGLLETIRIRKNGYPVRISYRHFVEQYRCLLGGSIKAQGTKDLSRRILDEETSISSSSSSRDDYQLGATKIFMRESLETRLETKRRARHETEILKIQRVVRGYLARKRLSHRKDSALLIQSAYRGWIDRQKYDKIRRGIIALQALVRMKRQQRIFSEIKMERERNSRSLASQRSLRETYEKSQNFILESNSEIPAASITHKVTAGVNHLEVPAEYAFIMSKLESWKPVNTEKNIRKTSNVAAVKKPFSKLPSDIDYYMFSKVANIYFKSHLWQCSKEPIKTPFLSKGKESDKLESLSIFKLILRYMNQTDLRDRKEKLLSDYIIQKGLLNDKLRDEIYCQLANQTWKNESEENAKRGWELMANVLSGFYPSKTLHKYLLKYVSDHGMDGYKYLCQQKLLQINNDFPPSSRYYPPTLLEYTANKQCAKMSLNVLFSDGESRFIEVESFMRAKEIASLALRSRGLTETSGWTLTLSAQNFDFSMNGDTYVLDSIGEMELPSAWPKGSGNNGSLISKMTSNNDSRTFSSKTRLYDKSQSPLLSRSSYYGLSHSALNDRYFDSDSKNPEGHRSRSLDNLLQDPNSHFSQTDSRSHDWNRNHKTEIPRSSSKEIDESWKNYGLSKTRLNDRYFSQPDLEVKGSEEFSESQKNERSRLRRQERERFFEFSIDDEDKKTNARFIKYSKRRGDKSSALSDTSEAPSLASHVRRVRVPSQASDVDQFLDDLFIPALDENGVDDGLSDAKSLAASMRGGKENSNHHSFNHNSNVIHNHTNGSIDSRSLLTTGNPMMMLSPPTQSFLLPQQGSNGLCSSPEGSSGIAFTYVPIPVYNMGSLPLSSGRSINDSGTHFSMTANGESDGKSFGYQQAFLQNAVAQNMQIQQQLMLQNQALSQLLGGPGSQTSMVNVTPSLNVMPLQKTVKTHRVNVNEEPDEEDQEEYEDDESSFAFSKIRQNRISSSGESFHHKNDFDVSLMDPYMRARTVRIGKWRWPPPKEETENESSSGQQEGFFEFKMRKMVERKVLENYEENGKDERWEDSKDFSDERSDDTKSSSSGNVGKLKISLEMKRQLERVTGSRKNSLRSSALKDEYELKKPESAVEIGVHKLNENRKLLLEAKLSQRESGKVKSKFSESKSNNGLIPTPPPLPINGSNSSITPPSPPPRNGTMDKHEDSSFYSPSESVFDFSERKTERRSRIEKFDSITTHQPTSPNSEFLISSSDPLEDDYQAVEDIKTRLHSDPSNIFLTYDKVSWSLKLRKEIFFPNEIISSSLTVHLIFCQIVEDVFSPLCIRLSPEERDRMKTLFDEYNIDTQNVESGKHKLSTKNNIIELAKDFESYFARFYSISYPGHENVQYLSVSQSGVRLHRRTKAIPTDYMEVLQIISIDDIGEVSLSSTFALSLISLTGARLTLHSNQANEIKTLLNSILRNGHSTEYVRAYADFSSKRSDVLPLKKGDMGWLYGFKEGHGYGLIPSKFVQKLSPESLRRENRVISKVKSSHLESRVSDEELIDETDVVDSSSQRALDTWNETSVKPQLSSPISSGHQDDENLSDVSLSAKKINNDGKNPLLEFALQYFRQSGKDSDVELSSSLNSKNDKKKKKKKKKKKNVESTDWTWKYQVEIVKWTDNMIGNSLLRLDPPEYNKMALECFASIMRIMGDLGLLKTQHEVDCVNTILSYCHKFESIRDEVYCQIMKQTTNNKSEHQDSCQRGWRFFTILAAYFTCSDTLKPYLFKYLETAAYDRRRAYHGTALVALHNLRKTFKYGGRKKVPSIEEITAISAGRSSKRQIYRLPGGTEKIINTKSTTVVDDIVDELCHIIGVESKNEKEEFSLYCIVEGETFTMPLAKDYYILDVTTELQRDGSIYYLIFCRSVWHYPLRLDNRLYIEVVFNQIAPDYLEGLLLVMPGEQIEQNVVYDICKVAACLHRAADMSHKPTIKETKFLLPKPALSARDIKPPQWVSMVQDAWKDIASISTSEAKASVLQILSDWPLFGSSFFAVRRESDGKEESEHILALNKHGVSFLDLITHEGLLQYPFTEVISTRKVQTEDGTLFLDMKCGNLLQQRISRIQTDQANEIARLIRQYITIDQRMKGSKLENTNEIINK